MSSSDRLLATDLWSRVLEVASSAALLLAALAAIWRFVGEPSRRRPPDFQLPTQLVSLKGLQSTGGLDAKAVMVEFADFQCPFCRKFASETWPAIRQTYVATGRLRFAYHHLPLEQIHPLARQAAMLAECGGQQGRFWEIHDLFYSAQDTLASMSSAHALASAAGLDEAAVESCLKGPVAATVTAAMIDAQKLGIDVAPTFLFGTVVVSRQVVEILAHYP